MPVDKDDLSRHDKWLCMIYPRLKLLHRLLANDGVIFISIDDNEMANLKLLCDEIWGQNNFISLISNITGAHQSGDGVLIQKNIEYCFVYAKNISLAKINRIDKTEETYRNLNDAPTPLSTRLEMGYTIYYNKKTKDMMPVMDYDKELALNKNTIEEVYSDRTDLIKQGYVPIRPGFRNNKLHRWRWGIDTFIERMNEIVIFETARGLSPKFKQEGFNAPKNIVNFAGGTNELKKIFGNSPFDYSKGVSYIEYLLSIGSDQDSIILDSFAGSGTTAHAVLELNKKDGGNRKFILVEMEDYAEDITAERVRRVIKGYGKDPEITATGGDFSFYELGEKLLLDDGNLNEKVGKRKIREYIYYSETKCDLEFGSGDYLGECNGVKYYFIYEKNKTTSLDYEYISKLEKASGYVIYADTCILSKKQLEKYNITFKKIPRDIREF